MRLILKLFAAPLALVFTIATAFFSFILSVSGVIFGIASTLVFIISVALFVTGQTAGGIAFLIIAFLVSPFGLPALAGWFAGKLGVIAGALKAFLFS
jgi:hypothetical protein